MQNNLEYKDKNTNIIAGIFQRNAIDANRLEK